MGLVRGIVWIGFGMPWFTWGCDGPFLDTLGHHEGEQERSNATTHIKHRRPWFSRLLDGHERESWRLMVLMLGLVWAPLGLCWAALRVGLGIHWATWGCHGSFVDTLMKHEGEQRQPNLEIREEPCKNHGFSSLR